MAKVSPNKNVFVKADCFGNSKACLAVAEMMNKNVITIPQKHKTLRFIHQMTVWYKGLIRVNPGVREHFANLLRRDIDLRIDKMLYDKNFLSHLKNVNAFYCRKTIRGK